MLKNFGLNVPEVIRACDAQRWMNRQRAYRTDHEKLENYDSTKYRLISRMVPDLECLLPNTLGGNQRCLSRCISAPSRQLDSGTHRSDGSVF